MALTKKGKRILSLHAKFHRRDRHGRFIKETNREKVARKEQVLTELRKTPRKFKKEIAREEKRVKKLEKKIDKFLKYKYVITFDYSAKKTGKRGKHPFHAELQIISPKRLTLEEALDLAIQKEPDFEKVFSSSKLSLGEPDVEETDSFVTVEVKFIKHDHKG